MSVSFLYDNKIISFGGTLSSDSNDPAYPVNNVKNYNAASVWRSVDIAGTYHIVHDFGSATNINATAIANCNFTSSGDVHIQASTTSNFAVLNVDETFNLSAMNTIDRFNVYHKLASAQVYRYWRLEITDAPTDNFYQVGEWFLGLHTTLSSTQLFELPFERIYPDTNVIHRTEYLQPYVYQRNLKALQRFTINFRAVTSSTNITLKNMILGLGGSAKPFFFCPDDTAAAPEAFFVRHEGDFISSREKPTIFNATLNMIELPRGLSLPSAA